MKPVHRIHGVVLPIPQVDIDTDQIIPKQFLKSTSRSGYGRFLFHDRRQDPGFPLDDARFDGASILAAGHNFGCGSSREHAAWALHDHGIRAVLSTGLADIFRTNCFQTGIVPVELTPSEMDAVFAAAAKGRWPLTIDVERQAYEAKDGVRGSFALDPFRRQSLLEGWDDIRLTMEVEEAITRFEEARSRAPVPEGRASSGPR